MSARATPRRIADPQLQVALVAAACLLLEAVLAKNVLDVTLDFLSQFVPFWVFVAYLVSGLRGRAAELWAIAAVLLATAAVLLAYAV